MRSVAKPKISMQVYNSKRQKQVSCWVACNFIADLLFTGKTNLMIAAQNLEYHTVPFDYNLISFHLSPGITAISFLKETSRQVLGIHCCTCRAWKIGVVVRILGAGRSSMGLKETSCMSFWD